MRRYEPNLHVAKMFEVLDGGYVRFDDVQPLIQAAIELRRSVMREGYDPALGPLFEALGKAPPALTGYVECKRGRNCGCAQCSQHT